MAEFESGAQTSVGKERGAQAGAERDREFHAVALDGAIALHGGVVGNAHRLLPALFEFLFQRKAVPQGMKIRGGIGDAFLDHAGESDRDAIEMRAARCAELSRPLSTALGVGMAGVTTRSRSLTGLPWRRAAWL